jgi:hypothetical protein
MVRVRVVEADERPARGPRVRFGGPVVARLNQEAPARPLGRRVGKRHRLDHRADAGGRVTVEAAAAFVRVRLLGVSFDRAPCLGGQGDVGDSHA